MGSEEGILEWDLKDELEFVRKRSPVENWWMQRSWDMKAGVS